MAILIKDKTGATLHTVTSDTLYGVDLSNLDLTGADFRNAALPYADFTDTILTNADFDNAKVSNATFSGADLVNSNWTQAITTDADFTNAYLVSNLYKLVKAEESGLTASQLEKEMKYFGDWVEILA